MRPRAEYSGSIYTNNRQHKTIHIPDKVTTETSQTKSEKKNYIYGQTAKSRSIQIDIVISYNIIVCNRIRVPCPAGGRTSKKKNLHWLWHLKMFILVLWMILSKYQYISITCNVSFYLCSFLNKNLFKRIGIEVLYWICLIVGSL